MNRLSRTVLGACDTEHSCADSHTYAFNCVFAIIPPPAAVSTVIGADCKNKNPCHKYPIQFLFRSVCRLLFYSVNIMDASSEHCTQVCFHTRMPSTRAIDVLHINVNFTSAQPFLWRKNHIVGSTHIRSDTLEVFIANKFTHWFSSFGVFESRGLDYATTQHTHADAKCLCVWVSDSYTLFTNRVWCTTLLSDRKPLEDQKKALNMTIS